MPLNYSRWKHRITYSLSPVTTVADRWVTFVLPWQPGIRADYADIRFSDSAGNSLSYNVASKTDRVTATVKIEIPTAGTRLIHLYFGNSQASSESTASGTEDANPVLAAVSGTTNPEYSGAWTYRQAGRLNQQGYARGLPTGPYPKWRYKALIKITNPVSTANYQHKLTLSWLPGMRSDFRDIRFAQINGKKCDYWIESYTSRASAVVWIEVPTAGQTWLSLYYGNGRSASESSGTNTFDFFDDFSDGNITSPAWTVKSGTWSAVSYKLAQTSGTSPSVIETANTHTDIILEADVAAYTYAGIIARRSGSVGGYCFRFNSAGTVNVERTSIALLQQWNYSWTAGTIYRVKLAIHGTSIDCYINDVLIGTATDSTYSSGTQLGCFTYTTSSATFDTIRARKYTATEPTLSLVSHQPNATCSIIPYETLGDQPSGGGTTYVMDPIEFGITVAPVEPVTTLQPLIAFGFTVAPSAPVTTLQPLVEFGYIITGSVISRSYIALDEMDLTQISVSRSVTDDIWAMSATVDGYTNLATDVLKHATFATTDHNGTTRAIFAGIIPKSSVTIKDAANRTVLTGYDYAWYLARQTVPSTYQHNTAGTNPADVITGILGGDDWEETTGIQPYNINQVAGWGTTLNSRVFDFPVGTTKKQAIDKICAYCRYIFMVKWTVVDGIATPAAYFISEDDIDTELDLPAAVTFAYPDPYLADSIKPVIKGDERYNRVTVIGRDNSGGVFTATVESPSVEAGDELAVEYVENSGSWTTQAQVNARAQELYDYYSLTAYTYTATLLDRMDLELLQKIRITGYTGVSENWMRITKIKKTVKGTANGVEKTVDIEFTENVKWSALRRMYRYSSDDLTDEMTNIATSVVSKIGKNELGTVDSVDGDSATVELDDGSIVTVRNP